MDTTKIGISDIGLYLPGPRITMDDILRARSVSHPELVPMLTKAIKKSGLTAFRFPEQWEDTASMAANASAAVLDNMKPETIANLRCIVSGTETAVDHSKPVSAYLQGMLQKAGYPVGNNLYSFEVKHACAGGTAALLSSAAMLVQSGKQRDWALVSCSDISRYEAPSTAELTQGAGAAAIAVEHNPKLLEIDLRHQGLYSSDVDDFFRPLGSVTAKVKGRYSMECYQNSLIAAFNNYCERMDAPPQDVLDSIDYLSLHVPFPKMPEVGITKLASAVYNKDTSAVKAFLDRTKVLESMYLNKETGNLYTVSPFAHLVALLYKEWEEKAGDIVGKTVLLASYGSGNTMIVYSMRIAPQAPSIISRWRIREVLVEYRHADFHDYLNWISMPKDYMSWKNLLEGARPKKGMFYLKDFADTGLRIYSRG